MTGTQRFLRRPSPIVGLLIAILGLLGWWHSALQPIDRAGLDLHFRYANSMQPDPRIVLVEIDDQALSAVGSWPWPRRRYAELLEVLSELGVSSTVLDLLLSEPSGEDTEATIGLTLSETLGTASSADDQDDSALEASILGAGNVYLAMACDLLPAGSVNPANVDWAVGILRSNPQTTVEELKRQVEVPNGWTDESLHAASSLAAQLVADFTCCAPEDASSIHLDLGAEHQFRQAKHLAARLLAAEFTRTRPGALFNDFLSTVLPADALDIVSADRLELLKAFRAETSKSLVIADFVPDAAGDHSAGGWAEVRKRIPQVAEAEFPLPRFCRGARGVGFVSIPRFEPGRTVRSIPLMANLEGAMAHQLAFVVGCNLVGLDRSVVSQRKSQLVIGLEERVRRIPLNADGATLVNWCAPRTGHLPGSVFDQLPVTRLLEVADNRRAMHENEIRLAVARAELVRLRHADTPSEYARYVELINKLIAESMTADARANTASKTDLAKGDLASARLEVERIEREALNWLERAWGLWRDVQPANDAERAEREQLRRAYERFSGNSYENQIRETNRDLERRMAGLLAELRPRVQDKVCLVGYTATAVADFVSTPVGPNVPGVVVHANVLNMVLRDRFATFAPKWMGVLMLLVGGGAVALFTGTRGPAASAVFLLVLCAILGALGATVFYFRAVHLPALVTCLVGAATWAGVTSVRQLSEERVRRRLQRALVQYTSPAVAAHIAERADASLLAPRAASVTCFFADLKGFTRISECLGPARTKDLLNPYLASVSGVLVQDGAMVNKFIGDGVFAFFNAPLWPCARHAESACRSALAVLAIVKDLGPTSAQDETVQLHVRIGMATGEAFVGDYGSDTKLDYTCIGDTVNVASRLERANKILGTSILVEERTRQAAEGEFVFRRLGLFHVPGREAAVDVSELIGIRSDVSHETVARILEFEAAVCHFQRCQWDACLEALKRYADSRSEDLLVAQYRKEVAERRRIAMDRIDPAISLSV